MAPPPARLAVVLSALALACACQSGAELRRRVDDTARSLRDVEARGAMRCAPRELALAQSHLEFARLERDRGAPTRAHQHLDVADENVRAAAELSPVGRCSKPAR
jgi:hypothetical protein